MQFNVAFMAAALLASASPAMSAIITAFDGPGCTGTLINMLNVTTPNCIFFTHGVTAKSFGYSGVPNQISFFKSGGQNDKCTNGAFLVLGGGFGCGTAPDGFNIESVLWS